jgi:hypothetical protein
MAPDTLVEWGSVIVQESSIQRRRRMASRRKVQRLIATLKELAIEELGQGAEPIDFVVQRVSSGQTVTALAHDVASAMGEPASRSWLSWRFNHLTPGAKERIAAARYASAYKLAPDQWQSNGKRRDAGQG